MSVNSRIYVDKSMILGELNQLLNMSVCLRCVCIVRTDGDAPALISEDVHTIPHAIV